jgi:hypothetical protein
MRNAFKTMAVAATLLATSALTASAGPRNTVLGRSFYDYYAYYWDYIYPSSSYGPSLYYLPGGRRHHHPGHDAYGGPKGRHYGLPG